MAFNPGPEVGRGRCYGRPEEQEARSRQDEVRDEHVRMVRPGRVSRKGVVSLARGARGVRREVVETIGPIEGAKRIQTECQLSKRFPNPKSNKKNEKWKWMVEGFDSCTTSKVRLEAAILLPELPAVDANHSAGASAGTTPLRDLSRSENALNSRRRNEVPGARDRGGVSGQQKASFSPCSSRVLASIHLPAANPYAVLPSATTCWFEEKKHLDCSTLRYDDVTTHMHNSSDFRVHLD